MKLLFDENLSPRLVTLLADVYPDAMHVRDVGLASANDNDVWSYAQKHGLTIVSKDEDFHQRSFLLGAPPKVVWVRLGNCSTQDIATLLRKSKPVLSDFDQSEDGTFLALG